MEIGKIRIPVEIDVYAVLDGERTRIGTAESEMTLGVTTGMASAKTRGGQDRVNVHVDPLPVAHALGEITRRLNQLGEER